MNRCRQREHLVKYFCSPSGSRRELKAMSVLQRTGLVRPYPISSYSSLGYNPTKTGETSDDWLVRNWPTTRRAHAALQRFFAETDRELDALEGGIPDA